MNNRRHIQNELKSLQSGLPASGDSMPFSVPEDYFNGLAATILAKAKGMEPSAAEEISGLSPLLAGMPRTTPYALPAGYFEGSSADLASLASEPDSPLLQSIGKRLPYSVPSGYFETFPQLVRGKVMRPGAKVVPLFARRWMRVAAAAVVAGALCVAGLRYFGNTGANRSAAQNVPDTPPSAVAKNGKPALSVLKTISTTELRAFVKEVRVPLSKRKNAAQSSEKPEAKDLLKDVSATELEKFLSEVPVPDEDVFITNVP